MRGKDSSNNDGGSQRNARLAFILLFLLYTFDYIDRLVVVSLFPFLKRDWGLSDAQCGLLVSAVYWSILVFTLPVSMLIDRWSRKKSIGLMSLLWSLATLACAFTTGYGQLFAARSVIGVGEAGYAPGGTAMISALYPEEKRARMLGIWNASIPLGSALGIALGGIIAEYFGWRHAFGIVALPGFLVALLFFRVRDYRTVDLVKSKASGEGGVRLRMSRGEIVSELLHSRALILNNLAFACCTFVTTSLLSWLPSFFHRVEGLPMSEASVKGGAVMMLAIIGAPIGGYCADLWIKKRLAARMIFPALSSTVTAILLFVDLFFFNGNMRYALLLGVGVSVIMFVPSAIAVTQDVVHPGLRATSLSINVIVQHLLGSALGPPSIGALSDSIGIEKAMLLLPLFLLVAGVLFFAGSFFYEGDLKRVERVEIDFER